MPQNVHVFQWSNKHGMFSNIFWNRTTEILSRPAAFDLNANHQGPSGLFNHFLFLTVLTSLWTLLLSVVACFSNMANFVPLLKLPSAKETAQLVLHHVFHSIFDYVVSPVCIFIFAGILQSAWGHGQPFLWFLPPVQWSDWMQEPGDGKSSRVSQSPCHSSWFGWSMPTVVYRHPALLLACPLSIVHMAINHCSVGRLPLKPSFASAPNLWSNLLQTPLICQPLCSLCQSMLHSSTHLPGWPGSSTINIPLRAKSQVSAP